MRLNVLISVSILQLVLLACASGVRAQPDSNSSLIQAIKTADLPSVQKLLNEGVDCKCKDAGGNSALMLATLYATPEVMKVLLDSGADPNDRNKAGATALMWAIGDLEKVRLLVDRGAKVNAQADVTQT